MAAPALIAAAYGTARSQDHAADAKAGSRFHDLLAESGLKGHLVAIDPRTASKGDILRFHTPAYFDRVKQVGREPCKAGVRTVRGHDFYSVALKAAGGVIAAVESVVTGQVDDAYALVWPSGHQAQPHEAQGRCIFGNAVIAARHATQAFGLAKIAFVDWAIHHGSGTETAFWNDPGALVISIHQDRLSPTDRGFVHHWGEGAGDGYNINIPLPPGSGVGAYLAAFEQVVIPALYAYAPDLIIVPSGFDSGAFDPIGRNMMTSEGFRKLTRMVKCAARDLCGGRLVFCHEGGHSWTTVPFMGLAVMEELTGLRTDVDDPFLAMANGMAGQDLQPHQQLVIHQAREVLKRSLLRA